MPEPRSAARAAPSSPTPSRTRGFARAAFVAACAAVIAAPSAADSLAGAYLAGRYASGANDADAAARYLLDALGRDPGNAELADLALINLIAAGRVVEALPVAEDLAARDPGNRLANLTLLARDLRDRSFAPARPSGPTGSTRSSARCSPPGRRSAPAISRRPRRPSPCPRTGRSSGCSAAIISG